MILKIGVKLIRTDTQEVVIMTENLLKHNLHYIIYWVSTGKLIFKEEGIKQIIR